MFPLLVYFLVLIDSFIIAPPYYVYQTNHIILVLFVQASYFSFQAREKDTHSIPFLNPNKKTATQIGACLFCYGGRTQYISNQMIFYFRFCNPVCGADICLRRQRSLASVDRCTALPSLHPPPAALPSLPQRATLVGLITREIDQGLLCKPEKRKKPSRLG